MGYTQSKAICLISLSVVFGLVGCVNTGALKPTEQGKQWFCVPQESDEWLCEKDDTSFKQLAPVKPAETESKWTVGRVSQKAPQEESINEAVLEESDKFVELEEGIVELEELAVSESNSNDGQQDPLSIANSASTLSSSTQPSAEPSLVASSNSSESAAIQGTTSVKDTSQSPSVDISPWVVQLAAYRAEDSAERFVQDLGQGRVFKTRVKGESYFSVVLLGFDTRFDAEQVAQAPSIRQLGISPWIRRGASLQESLFD